LLPAVGKPSELADRFASNLLMLDYFQTGASLGASKGNHPTQGSQGNLVRDLRINDLTLSASDKVQSLTFGASSILGRAALVVCKSEAGLTNCAPNIPVVHTDH
jgi:hypothetical protein